MSAGLSSTARMASGGSGVRVSMTKARGCASDPATRGRCARQADGHADDGSLMLPYLFLLWSIPVLAMAILSGVQKHLDTTHEVEVVIDLLRLNGPPRNPMECESVHMRFIHSMARTHRYDTLTRVTSVPMLCGLIWHHT